MSNQTTFTAPRAIRLHIAIFGKRNAGKSSLINAISNQELAIVSPIAGTTTDPVYKSMEIKPIGAVTLIDTAGIDDAGELGELRVQKARQVLAKTDLILLAIAANSTPDEFEAQILEEAKKRNIPVLAVITKKDLLQNAATNLITNTAFATWLAQTQLPSTQVNNLDHSGILTLRDLIVEHAPKDFRPSTIVGDLLQPLDTVILVCPIDAGAPESRLILPQVQVLRDVMDAGAIAMVVTEKELSSALAQLITPPVLVITDSQVFASVAKIVPETIPLTSFSILFARYKGDLSEFLQGVKIIDTLQAGDKILIAEACTHFATCEDIGRVKIPNWLEKRIGGKLQFEFMAGGDFAADLSEYKLVIHCGGCMINRAEMLSRIEESKAAHVPVINYGILIGFMTGVLDRVVAPLITNK